MIKSTLFTDSQGGGYITDQPEYFEEAYLFKPETQGAESEALARCFDLKIGNRSTLLDFFIRPILYVGQHLETGGHIFRLNEATRINGKLVSDPIGAQIKFDYTPDLFYYQEVFIISPTRIFLMYNPYGGRDWNLVNGKWK